MTLLNPMIDFQAIDPFSLPWLPFGEVSSSPNKPAIYFVIDGDQCIQYIGKAESIKKRWYFHHKAKEIKQMQNVKISYLFMDKDLLTFAEKQFICKFNPPLNVVHNPFGRVATIEQIGSSKKPLSWWAAESEIPLDTLKKWTYGVREFAPFSDTKMIKVFDYGLTKSRNARGATETLANSNAAKAKKMIERLQQNSSTQ